MYTIGVDVGGTFTDTVVVDDEGQASSGKSMSTPPAFVDGVMNSLADAAEERGLTLEGLLASTRLFAIGTTIGTNAISTRTGARVGIITTVGHGDAIHIARGMSKWGGLPEAEIKHMAATRKPDPIVPKTMIKEVRERIDRDGQIVCPLNTEDVSRAAEDLKANGADSIAISFLWSFKNPDHEQKARKIVGELYPEMFVTTSHEVAPVIGEYERTMTAVFDCYIGPIMRDFLSAITRKLETRGLKSNIVVMKADGGCAFSTDVLPVATIHSGPAGGVIGAKYVGELLGHENIITTDVGGTTFDVSLIRNRSLHYAREPVMGQYHVCYPTLEITSIGSGGGTLVWVNPQTGTLHVGPDSAGAKPGPACYGLGGIRPTVCDADVLLGYLNPEYFLGGKMKLHPEKARDALKTVADPLSMDVIEVAAGVYDIINAHMLDLINGITVRHGYNPDDFVLYCFGGAGPSHLSAFAGEMGVKEIIIPREASTYSALGLAIADLLHTHVLFDYNTLPMDADRFNRNFKILEDNAWSDLENDGISEKDRTINYFLNMKYGLQIHEIRVPVARKTYSDRDIEALDHVFDSTYEKLYGKGSGYPAAGRIITQFISQGFGRISKLSMFRHKLRGPDPYGALKGRRKAFFRKYSDFVDTDIYDYNKLNPGNTVDGP
ncbi:MAG: hydantoinase/oxoprolinase family protein, partial [Deltaproteobacteria bacterium]|nr:hydantoinase/oxoprolinase family protein [Deltaproteobacteria bacterium]